MVIDTSAIFAAIAAEPVSSIYRRAIISRPLRLISAVTLLDARIVLASRPDDSLIDRTAIAAIPFGLRQPSCGMSPERA